MTRRNVRKQEWVFPLSSPDSDDRLSLNFHRFGILYVSCDTRSVGLGQYRKCIMALRYKFKMFCKREKLELAVAKLLTNYWLTETN